MPVPNNVPLFGFEIFKEIEMELSKMKNVFPYSNNNDSYNAIVDLCIQATKNVEERKRQDLDDKFWD